MQTICLKTFWKIDQSQNQMSRSQKSRIRKEKLEVDQNLEVEEVAIERNHQNDLIQEIEKSRVEEVEVEIEKIENDPKVEIVNDQNPETEKSQKIEKDRDQKKNHERNRDPARQENQEKRHDPDQNQLIECIEKELQVQKIKQVLKKEILELYQQCSLGQGSIDSRFSGTSYS